MSLIESEQVNVTKHLKISNSKVKLDIHSSEGSIGLWLTPRNCSPGRNTIGMFCSEEQAYFMVYPKSKEFTLPFAVTTEGIQVPTKDGGAKIISFDFISDFVSKLDI